MSETPNDELQDFIDNCPYFRKFRRTKTYQSMGSKILRRMLHDYAALSIEAALPIAATALNEDDTRRDMSTVQNLLQYLQEIKESYTDEDTNVLGEFVLTRIYIDEKQGKQKTKPGLKSPVIYMDECFNLIIESG